MLIVTVLIANPYMQKVRFNSMAFVTVWVLRTLSRAVNVQDRTLLHHPCSESHGRLVQSDGACSSIPT